MTTIGRPSPVLFPWGDKDLSKEQDEQRTLFFMRQQARETPACCFWSPEFHRVRAELERSESRAIRKHALRLPIAYQDVGDSA